MYEYGFRVYDPRLRRFLSIDPLFKTYPYYTPYQYAGNSPIAFIDLDGLERVLAITFYGDVNYRADRLELMNEDEISRKVLTNDPTGQLVEAFKEASTADENGIGFVAIWGHGTPNSQWGTNSSTLLKDDLDQLQTAIDNGEVSFTDNAIIYIGNCNACTCDANGESFAQELADITGAKVVAGSTDNYDDPNRYHRGSVGVKNESNGNLQYTMWYPNLDNFKVFEQGETPTTLDGTIDIQPLLERGKSLPMQKIEPKKITTIPVNIPEQTIKQ